MLHVQHVDLPECFHPVAKLQVCKVCQKKKVVFSFETPTNPINFLFIVFVLKPPGRCQIYA